MEKMQDYKAGLNEKNIQPLDDDYIKFIRFAQHKIEQNKQGIIGFITNNSYLGGIIHRQMRKTLLSSFDRIYILNLHGDSRREETTPSGGKDENVFDIQQGVAIALFIKNRKFEQQRVFYYDSFGLREEKFQWLDRNDVNSAKWQELKPVDPYYFLKPQESISEYEQYISLRSIFRQFNAGLVTGRDDILSDIDKQTLIARMRKILSSDEIPEYQGLLDNSAGRKIVSKRLKFRFNVENVRNYDYRPFDRRYVYYLPDIMERPRQDILRNMLHDNVGIVVSRINTKKEFDSVLITQSLPDYKLGESTRGSYIFPLYIYHENSITREDKETNFTEDFERFLRERYPSKNITPLEVLGYIYAVLFSARYRERYRDSLKIDFPRIPFVSDYDEFESLSKIGNELIDLHLARRKLDTHTGFNVEGSNIVESVQRQDDKVYINKTQYFENVQEEEWCFSIGGYQVLYKWLKSRQNRELSVNEIEQFLQIVEIIRQTIECIKKIDGIDFLKTH